jgi:membrane-bound metal-dependent hydrolase YbcI (DUF457 family)
MPSPVGHALAALTVGWVAAGRANPNTLVQRSVLIAGLGLAPDLDFLIGRHSMETHSLGAALLAGAIAAAVRLPVASTRLRIFLTAALAWSTHPILDSLGADGSAPFGVMMFWPLSREHVTLAPFFDPISRRWWLDGFITRNLMAAVREVAILGPLAVASWLTTQREPRRGR